MVLVIGGYGQDKLRFARESLGVTAVNDGCFGDADCIDNLSSMVMGEHFKDDLEKYIVKHPDCVIICDEVGGGVVPIRVEDRMYREATGRVCCELAKKADAVYRVFCGIGQRIK